MFRLNFLHPLPVWSPGGGARATPPTAVAMATTAPSSTAWRLAPAGSARHLVSSEILIGFLCQMPTILSLRIRSRLAPGFFQKLTVGSLFTAAAVHYPPTRWE